MKTQNKLFLFFISVFFFSSVVSGFCNFLFPPLQKSTLITELNNQQVSSLVNNNMGFEPNLGQIGDFEGKKVNNVLFSVKEKGFSIFFKNDGVSYVIYRREGDVQSSAFNRFEDRVNSGDSKMKYARINLDLLNSNIQKSKIIYEDELPGYTNYYLAHCPEGVLNVKSYRKITVKEVYPGIDWVFRYDESGELHHEFVITPGANPEVIKFSVRYADVEISEDGKQLTLSTQLGKITDGRILSYEGINNVDVRYKFTDGVISYKVKNWTKKEKLIIDPPLALLWGTYYGGSGDDYSNSMVTDVSGNIFLTGWNYSTNFPTQNPGGGAYFQGTNANGYDIFILKFTNSGIRQWATYYGGSGNDEANSICSDENGNLYVTGHTLSTNLPTQNPGYLAYFQGNNAGNSDIFILKFSNTGIRYWATYYGGSNNDIGHSLTTDASGNLLVTGQTFSSNFPTLNPGGGAYFQQNFAGGSRDVFILKFSSICWRLWATFYGGSGEDLGRSLTTDASGNFFVTGQTSSANFPVFNPFGGAYFQGTYTGVPDAFVLKFSNSGICQWATFYGGGNIDLGDFLTTDASGNLFVTGCTYSTNFPTQNPGFLAYFQGNNAGGCDAFILKFSNTGNRYWATYYGGSNDDYGNSLITDASGNLFVTGETASTNFPTQNPGGGAYFQQNAGGGSDAFILKFSNLSWRQWATYYGGSGFDNGSSLTSDASGNLFVTGYTVSANFPIYNPFGGAYFQGTNAGNNDAFILEFESSSIGIQPVGTQIPLSFNLKQNYPNPFNPVTNIEFDIPKSGYISLTVYDITGREVSSLVNGKLQPGTYEVTFKADYLPSGIYFYQLKSNNFVDTKKLILVK